MTPEVTPVMMVLVPVLKDKPFVSAVTLALYCLASTVLPEYVVLILTNFKLNFIANFTSPTTNLIVDFIVIL